MSRHIAGLVGLALVLLCFGCATSTQHEGAVNPAFFPRVAVPEENRAPGQVALWPRPPAQGQVFVATEPSADGLQVPIGRIVEEAVLMAVGDALNGGAVPVNELPPAGSGFAATLVIEAIRVDQDHEKHTIVLPIPPFVAWMGEPFGRIGFDLRLLDAQGRTVWIRSYDGGRTSWQPTFWNSESVPAAIVRHVHETAWRLAQQAVADLREWLDAERNKPRKL